MPAVRSSAAASYGWSAWWRPKGANLKINERRSPGPTQGVVPCVVFSCHAPKSAVRWDRRVRPGQQMNIHHRGEQFDVQMFARTVKKIASPALTETERGWAPVYGGTSQSGNSSRSGKA